MSDVIILSGIPGSGKSHIAAALRRLPGCTVVSADDYLPKNPTPPDFGIAHGKCFLEAMAWRPTCCCPKPSASLTKYSVSPARWMSPGHASSTLSLSASSASWSLNSRPGR